MMKLIGNEDFSYKKLKENKPRYDGMADFLDNVK